MARLLYQQLVPGADAAAWRTCPATAPALVVANHSGVLPLDAIMLQAGLHDEHPAHRNLRLLGADLVYEVPVLASLARRCGHTRACPGQRARSCCSPASWSGVFPEGFKGIGKPFRERYQLQRFGRGGFAAYRDAAPGCRSSRARSSAPRRSTR